MLYVFLNECPFDSFGGHFGLLSRHQQGIHFGSQSHERQGGSTITLIFKFPQNFGVLGTVQGLECIVCAVFWIGTGVQVVRESLHVYVHVVCLYVIAKTVCVGEQ